MNLIYLTITFVLCNTKITYANVYLNEAFDPSMSGESPIGYIYLLMAVIFTLPFFAYPRYLKLKINNGRSIISKSIKESMKDCGLFAVAFYFGGLILLVVTMMVISVIIAVTTNYSPTLSQNIASQVSNMSNLKLFIFIWWVTCLYWYIKKWKD